MIMMEDLTKVIKKINFVMIILIICRVILFRKQNNNDFKVVNVDEKVTEENLKLAYGINVKIIDTKIDNDQILKSSIPLLN